MTPEILLASVALGALVVPQHQRSRIEDLASTGPATNERALVTKVASALRRVVPVELPVGDHGLLLLVGSTVALLAVSPILALLPVAGFAGVTSHRRKSARVAAAASTSRSLPEMIDLLTLGIGSGLTARHALAMTAPWLDAPFSSALSEVVRRSDSGEPFTVALEVATADLGPTVRPLVNTLIAAETDGAALLPALLRVGDEARRNRRVEAEDRARRVPVAMLFPLVVCILPAFALLTVVPLLIGTLSNMSFPG